MKKEILLFAFNNGFINCLVFSKFCFDLDLKGLCYADSIKLIETKYNYEMLRNDWEYLANNGFIESDKKFFIKFWEGYVITNKGKLIAKLLKNDKTRPR